MQQWAGAIVVLYVDAAAAAAAAERVGPPNSLIMPIVI